MSAMIIMNFLLPGSSCTESNRESSSVKLFSEVPSSEIQDMLERSHRLMKFVPVEYPDHYLIVTNSLKVDARWS